MQLVSFTCSLVSLRKCVFAIWYCPNRRHVVPVSRCTTAECSETDLPVLQGMKCTYPVDRKQDAVELTEHDLVRLNDREMVNDSVVDFYVK